MKKSCFFIPLRIHQLISSEESWGLISKLMQKVETKYGNSYHCKSLKSTQSVLGLMHTMLYSDFFANSEFEQKKEQKSFVLLSEQSMHFVLKLSIKFLEVNNR